jgi:AraC family transcriptional regulator of arabinose operon
MCGAWITKRYRGVPFDRNTLLRSNDILSCYMASRQETPSIVTADLHTGHFHAEAGYFAYRSQGTRDWLLIHTLSGCGRFGFRSGKGGAETSGEIIAAPGDVVLLRPRVLHDYGVVPTNPRWELLWSHFHPRPAWQTAMAWPAVLDEEMRDTGLMRIRLSNSDAQKLAARFADVHRLTSSPHRNHIALAMNALEEVLLWCDEWNPSHREPIDPRIQAAMEMMCRTLSEPLRIEMLADCAGLSPSRFSHLFRAVAGTTPQRYHEQRRLDRARRLLEMTSMPMKAIARDLGFDNAFYFSRRFTLHTHCSPSEYRRISTQNRARRSSA